MGGLKKLGKKIEKAVTKPIKTVACVLGLKKQKIAECACNNVAPNFDDCGGAPTVPEQI